MSVNEQIIEIRIEVGEPEQQPAEPCTTASRGMLHWSTDLHTTSFRGIPGSGRIGMTLCGHAAQDQDRTDAVVAAWRGKSPVVLDLPPCSRCASSPRRQAAPA